MKIILEANKRLGQGYQVHIVNGPLDKTYDEEALDLVTAGQYASMALDSINQEMKTSYKIEEVLCVTDEALTANKGNDVMSMKFWKDTQSGDFKYSSPAFDNDEPEVAFTGRGVLGISFVTWKEDANQVAKKIMIKFCQLLAAKGYGKGAMDIWNELNDKPIKEGIEWINENFDKYNVSNETIISWMAK